MGNGNGLIDVPFFLQQISDMTLFEEQILVEYDDDECGDEQYKCFHAFGCVCHSDFFLHQVNKEMKDNARE